MFFSFSSQKKIYLQKNVLALKVKIFILSSLLFIQWNCFAQSPIEFIENKGQWKEDFNFKAPTKGGDIYLQKQGYVVNIGAEENGQLIHLVKYGQLQETKLKFHAYKVEFLNSNNNAEISTAKQQKHYYNYFLGNDSKHWASGIHPAWNVDYKNIYDNINIHYYSDLGKLKFDIQVAPNANTSVIQMKYTGLDGMEIRDKNLILKTSIGELQELKPYAYQFINGEKVEVACEYKLKNEIVSFTFPKSYNKNYELIIDPVLVFCTFSGSTADNWGTCATYDQYGFYYGGGHALGAGFPTALGNYTPVFQPNFAGGNSSINGIQQDMAILRYDPLGTDLIFATYLGGTHNEQPHSMIVDTTNGHIIVAGRTYSSDFPVPNAYDPTLNGGADLTVSLIDSTGMFLLASTYIGGSGDEAVNISPVFGNQLSLKHNYGDDARSEVMLDNAGNIYVAAMTNSANFPSVGNQLIPGPGGAQDGVIVELNPSLTNLLWSTRVGGSGNDACYVLTFDKTAPDRLYVAGGTESPNFPTTANALHTTYQGNIDGFVLRINALTKTMVASTYIGTNNYDQVYGVQTDDSSNVFIMGQSQGAYPVTAGVYTNPNSPQFVTKLNSSLNNILVSTVFGNGSLATTNISPTAFLVDRCRNIYVGGWGGSTGGNPGSTVGLPVTPNALQGITDGFDFYYFVLDKNATSLLYATFFGLQSSSAFGGEHVDGGTSRFDPKGIVYQGVCAACNNTPGFPTTPGCWSSTNNSNNCNHGAIKIDFQLQDPEAIASANGPNIGCVPFTVAFNNTSTSSTGYTWNFGDGSPTTNQASPTHTFNTAGTFTVTLVAENPNGCLYQSDTTELIITVLDDTINANFTYAKVDSCNPFTAIFTNTSTLNGTSAPNSWTKYFWDFGDATTFNGINPPQHNFPSAQSYTVTLIMTDSTACNSPDTVQIVVDYTTSVVSAAFNCPDSVCAPALINFINLSTNATTTAWNFGDGNTSTTVSPNHTYTSPGTYIVSLLSGNPNTCNKLDSFSKTITVFTSPVANWTYTPNPTQANKPIQFINQSTGATSYDWDFGDGTTSQLKDPIKSYKKEGLYHVCLVVSNIYGCKDSLCKDVEGKVVPLADVPTGFSPNGDGINDEVRVLGYGIETMEFKIFNRWGQLVFETTNQDIGWDGTFKNVPQEMEVYAYTLDVKFFDGTRKFKKGNITLLR